MRKGLREESDYDANGDITFSAQEVAALIFGVQRGTGLEMTEHASETAGMTTEDPLLEVQLEDESDVHDLLFSIFHLSEEHDDDDGAHEAAPALTADAIDIRPTTRAPQQQEEVSSEAVPANSGEEEEAEDEGDQASALVAGGTQVVLDMAVARDGGIRGQVKRAGGSGASGALLVVAVAMCTLFAAGLVAQVRKRMYARQSLGAVQGESFPLFARAAM